MKRISVADQALAVPQFSAKIEGRYVVHPDSGCWEWTGPLNKGGYGAVTVRIDCRPRTTSAHRASWIAHHGPIPDGLHVDHLCRNRKCINPDHLEPVTTQENTRRGVRDGGFICTPESARKRGPRRPPHSERGCRLHGREDLSWRLLAERKIYVVWTCRICSRERNRSYHERKKREASSAPLD